MADTPYARSAGDYFNTGWSPIPLPPGKKSSPPKGYTGHDGERPSWPDVQAWMEDPKWGNIALRMPATVVGVDIDHPEKIDTASLPATWSSTARGADSPRRTRLYRVPEDLAWHGNLPDGAGEVIRQDHRYLVVAPSIHPEGGEYVIYGPDGAPAKLCRPEELPELPAEWIDKLANQERIPDLPASAKETNDNSSPVSSSPFAQPNKIWEFTRERAHEYTERALDKVRHATTNRNDRLNDAAVELWHFLDVPGGPTRAQLEVALEDAARACGLDQDPPAGQVGKTIASGLNSGPRGNRWKAVMVDTGTPTDNQSSTERSVLEFATLAQLRAKVAAAGPRKWLLRAIWPAGDYGVHAAEMKAGKTWNAVDLAVSVASGTPWLGGVAVDQPGPVIMFAGEGSEANLVRRIDAVCAGRKRPSPFAGGAALDPDTLPLTICSRAPKLAIDQHMQIMAGKIAEIRPALVIIDPLYLAARGAKGSDLYAMGEMLEKAQHVCQEHGAALFVVHHNNRTGANGAHAISGAGPAEWGRVLVTAEVKSRRSDPDSRSTTVITELDVIGGEVADTTWVVTRTVRADDPGDLNSPLRYTVTTAVKTPNDGNSDDDMPPARRALLTALQAHDVPKTGRELVDWIVKQGGVPLRRETCSRELNKLEDAGLAEHVDPGHGKAKLWLAVAQDATPQVRPVTSHPPDEGCDS